MDSLTSRLINTPARCDTRRPSRRDKIRSVTTHIDNPAEELTQGLDLRTLYACVMPAPAHEQRFVESVTWIRQMLSELNFDKEEIGYKIASADYLTEARRLVLVGDLSWTGPFVDGLRHSNQLNWRVKDDLSGVARQHPEQLAPLLELLWKGKPRRACFGDADGVGRRGSSVIPAGGGP